MKTKSWKDDELLVRCDCRDFEFIELAWFNNEPKTFYITLTCHPKDWKEKLRGIWRILRGSRYGITDGVLINKKEAKKIADWFQKRI